VAHHKPKTKINTYGMKRRLRRDRKNSHSSLTKGHSFSDFPNPDPKGKNPTTGWVLYHYPLERKKRRRRALEKRIERRHLLLKEKRVAFRDQDYEGR